MKATSLKKIFLLIQLLLFIVFIILDVIGGNVLLSSSLKFTVIVLCLLYVIINKNKNHTRQYLYLLYALTFTVVSDILLLFSDYYLFGVITFVLAQQLYGMRISAMGNSRKKPIRDLLVRVLYQSIASIIVGIILWRMNLTVNALLLVSVFYFLSICVNVMGSLKLFTHYRERRDIRYFTCGLILFLICDINVGLFNMSEFLAMGPRYELIYQAASILMWAFYAPSQVLIALSGDTI